MDAKIYCTDESQKNAVQRATTALDGPFAYRPTYLAVLARPHGIDPRVLEAYLGLAEQREGSGEGTRHLRSATLLAEQD